MPIPPKATLIATVAIGFTLLLAACDTGQDGMHGRRDARTTFDSNGERIYFTSESASGEPIRARSGPANASTMHDLACVDCHGEDGGGGRVTMMMETFTAPDISWHELSTEAHHEESEMEHPPYTAETLKLAVTQGVNPAGERLSNDMPRWEMSAADLNDLIAFLMTLGEDHEE